MRILRQSAPDSEDSAHTGPFCLHPLRACCTLHMRGCVRVPQVVCASLALHTLYLLTVLYLEFHQRKKRWRQSLHHGMLMVRPGLSSTRGAPGDSQGHQAAQQSCRQAGGQGRSQRQGLQHGMLRMGCMLNADLVMHEPRPRTEGCSGGQQGLHEPAACLRRHCGPRALEPLP